MYQANQSPRVEQLTPPVMRVVGDTPRVPRVEHKTPPTLRLEPITSQIQFPGETQYHTNCNDSTVNFTRMSNDVAPPLYQYPTRSKSIEVSNRISTVTPNTILYPIKLQINTAIHPDTGSSQKYIHLVKGDEK